MATDLYVQNTQKWLNDKFRGMSGYTEIEENGKTGWTTIYALLHGLQITLEVGSTANNFGPGTKNAFNAFIAANGNIQERATAQDAELQKKYESATGDEKERLAKLIDQYEKIHGIIQGALLCKGYSIGTNKPTGYFYAGTGAAIKQLKADAGLSDTTTVVTLNIMQALMSMDYFFSYDTSERTQKIINMQRYLNSNYEAYIGLTPCDGIYGRETSKSLIYAIQAEEGMSTSVANGNCGPSTKRCLPNIPYTGGYTKNGQTHGISYNGQTYSDDNINRFKKLLNMALYFNGVGTGEIVASTDSQAIMSIQEKYSLPATGTIDYTTWLALLISCGDIDRTATACDCATILDEAKAKTLYDNGYRYVGRYLSGTVGGTASKALTKEEIQIAFNNGLSIFPIYQDGGTSVSYFNKDQAYLDAEQALKYATLLEIPTSTTIYFAVDCDPQDSQITSNIIPYFEILSETLKAYKIGIYGTRNTCTRVCNLGYASSSFVSDMSTGYSGNLGFTIPDNWAYDQFSTITIGSGAGEIEIDKDSFSGRNNGFNTFESQKDRMYNNLKKVFDLAMEYTENNTARSNELVMHYFRNRTTKYGGSLFNGMSHNNLSWAATAGQIDSDFCNLVEERYGYLNLNFYVTNYSNANNEVIKYDMNHLCATINALLYTTSDNLVPNLDTLVDLYAGWGGDMISFAENVKAAAESGVSNLVQWAKDNICKNSGSNFNIDDYYADIDAVNIVNLMKEYELNFYAAFNMYFYTPLEEKTYAENRTCRYMNSVGSSNYIEGTCDILNEDGLGVIKYFLSNTFKQEYFDAAEEGFKAFLYSEYFYGR